MSFLSDEIIYITYDEFYLLLAAAGRKEIYSIDSFSGTPVPETKEEIYPIITELYKKGLFEWEDGKVSASEAFRPVFIALRDAAWCMISAVTDDAESFTAAYFSGDTVMNIRRSQRDTDTLAISFETSGEMIERFGEDGIFPDPIQTPARGGGLKPQERYMAIDESRKLADLLKDDQVRYAAELRSANDGLLKERMIVYDKGLYSVIYRQESSNCRYYLCEKEIWEKMIRSWMMGGEK